MKITIAVGVVLLASLVGCATEQKPIVISSGMRYEVYEQCKVASKEEIAALFDRWNNTLKAGDPHKVVADNYAEGSILLPTVSNKPRLTAAEKEDYFHHFIEKGPAGKIDMRHIQIGCNHAVDAGLYTFTFSKTGAVVSARYSYTYAWNGSNWLITSHHSSGMPEK